MKYATAILIAVSFLISSMNNEDLRVWVKLALIAIFFGSMFHLALAAIDGVIYG